MRVAFLYSQQEVNSVSNGNEAQEHEPDPAPDANEPLPAVIASETSDLNEPQGDDIERSPNPNVEPREQWFKNPDWYMVVLTALIFVVGIITGIVFYRQFKEMGRQTEILRKQAADAETASKDARDEFKEQINTAKGQVRAAQDSVSAITKQMRQDQRAWLKSEITFGHITPRTPIENVIRFTNIGKTLSLRTFAVGFVEIVDRLKAPSLYRVGRSQSDAWLTQGSLYPSEFADFVISRTDLAFKKSPTKERARYVRMTDEEAAKYNIGENYIATYGRATYRDIFGVSHYTNFCFWQGNMSTRKYFFGAEKCAEYDTSDNN
jgi:hypothetical protein